jgi:prepilin-type N-terminal cleavage/methylation domain-containing protein
MTLELILASIVSVFISAGVYSTCQKINIILNKSNLTNKLNNSKECKISNSKYGTYIKCHRTILFTDSKGFSLLEFIITLSLSGIILTNSTKLLNQSANAINKIKIYSESIFSYTTVITLLEKAIKDSENNRLTSSIRIVQNQPTYFNGNKINNLKPAMKNSYGFFAFDFKKYPYSEIKLVDSKNIIPYFCYDKLSPKLPDEFDSILIDDISSYEVLITTTYPNFLQNSTQRCAAFEIKSLNNSLIFPEPIHSKTQLYSSVRKIIFIEEKYLIYTDKDKILRRIQFKGNIPIESQPIKNNQDIIEISNFNFSLLNIYKVSSKYLKSEFEIQKILPKFSHQQLALTS